MGIKSDNGLGDLIADKIGIIFIIKKGVMKKNRG